MMRKIKTLYSRTLLLRAMACGLILTVLLNLAGFSAQCAALEENIVRLHVIANSDEAADQAQKLRVRDGVAAAVLAAFVVGVLAVDAVPAGQVVVWRISL